MAKNYVLDGYTTPAGVTDTESVKKMQRMLGVTADGVWGPQSQRAYDTRMDGISDSYYPNNEKNARMRDVSAPYHSQSTQYQNIRGISDPYFSGGDEYVGYTEYLNERAQRNNSSADDEPVIEVQVRKSLGGGNSTQKKQEEWMKQVSASLPGASTVGTGKNPWGGSMPYTQDPYDILAQRTAAQQATNGFGAFRLAAQKSDEEMLRRENGKKAIDTGKDAVEKYGLSTGTMPVPQYGLNPAAGSTTYNVYPVSPTLPWQSPDYSGPSHGGEPVDFGDAVDIAGFSLNQIGEEVGQSFSKAGGEVLGTIGDILGLVNFGNTVNEDLNDDGKIGIKTGTAVSGAIGSVVGNAIGTALVLLVGAGLGIATGGLAIPAFIGGLVVSGLGEEFATDMAMTAYDRFTHPDPERVAEQMEHANYLMGDLAEYATDNRISSSMPVPVFY